MAIPESLPSNSTAEHALERLKSGNVRYRTDKAARPNADQLRRDATLPHQHPFATIITCADSRVSPELIFDQGIGDLFVIRVAGNIADDDSILGSIEYASQHLGVRLVVVMGHKSCGAVGAAVAHVDHDGPATHDHIDSLIDSIRPAVVAAREQGGTDDLLDRSIRTNASMVAEGLGKSEPVLGKLTALGVQFVPAYYDLGTGQVEWL